MCSNFIMAGVHFIILKINGIDVCHLAHEDAVQMFLNATDPILIEVCRERDQQPPYKKPDNNDCNVDNIRRVATTTTTNNGAITAIATTQPLLTLTNRKKVKSASNVTLMGSKQQNTATNASAKKKFTLYFPPPPSLQLSIENGINIDDENETLNTSYVLRNSNTPMQPSPSASSLNENDEDESSMLNHGHILADRPKLVSTAMQTDVNDFVSLFHVANAATTDQIIEEEHNLFEACLAPDIDIEEITLRKSDSNEHLGLTVCYSQTAGSNSGNTNSINSNTNNEDTSESCTEVYISDIQPDSIAGRDGRLRQGDQILQVNGKDVTNKKETETLIAENNNAVTLLVSRYLFADEDDFNDTCVAGLDIEDEEDDDEEEDEDEYFDENNLAYENCLITSNECIAPSKVILDTIVVTKTPTLPSAPVSVPTTTSSAKIEELHNRNIINTTGISTTATIATPSTTTDSPTKTQQQTARNKTSSRTQVFLKYDPLNHQNIKEHLKQVNHELAMLDCRMENLMAKSVPPAAASSNVEYDTEHIYETIPEDSESEPFYCSPYESSIAKNGYLNNGKVLAYTSLESAHLQQQKQRVAAWLGMQSSAQRQHIISTNGRVGSTLQHLPPHFNTLNDNSTGGGTIVTTSSRSKSGTMRSAATNATTGSSSSGGCGSGGGFGGNGVTCLIEHENSSSAYNTGGSNNSGAALTLVLNPPMQHEIEQMAVLRFNKGQRLVSPKDKLTSPKHQSSSIAVTQSASKMSTCATGIQRVTTPAMNCNFSPSAATRNSQPTAQTTATTTATGTATINNHQQFSSNTMYTNVANLQQTMLLQQQLFRQALTQQQQQSHSLSLQKQHEQQQVPSCQQNLHTMHACPQFTAPNLSQYHFVSSQEVSAEQMRVAAAAAVAKTSNEEPMVWKVKRRQDGTRYIVRRPARTRMLRDRALRINAERENYHELTTTEDDTISEIKTGRYWTREERKKHIERARERRQQQQQQLATTMRVTDKSTIINPTETLTATNVVTKIIKEQQVPAQQQLNKIQQRTNTLKLQHHQLQFGSTIQKTTDVTPTATKFVAVCNNNNINCNTKQQKQFLVNKNHLGGGNKAIGNIIQDVNTGTTVVSNVNVGSENAESLTGVTEATSTQLLSIIETSATTTTATITAAVTTTSTVNNTGLISGPVGAAGTQQQQLQQGVGAVQGTTSANNGNKLVGLLSVTTV